MAGESPTNGRVVIFSRSPQPPPFSLRSPTPVLLPSFQGGGGCCSKGRRTGSVAVCHFLLLLGVLLFLRQRRCQLSSVREDCNNLPLLHRSLLHPLFYRAAAAVGRRGSDRHFLPLSSFQESGKGGQSNLLCRLFRLRASAPFASAAADKNRMKFLFENHQSLPSLREEGEEKGKAASVLFFCRSPFFLGRRSYAKREEEKPLFVSLSFSERRK